MHVNAQYVMIPHLPNCAIENPGNSHIRDKYRIHEHIHPEVESFLHEEIGEYKVQEQLLESDDSWKAARAPGEGSERSTYIRTHRPAKMVMVGLEERASILLSAAPELL